MKKRVGLIFLSIVTLVSVCLLFLTFFNPQCFEQSTEWVEQTISLEEYTESGTQIRFLLEVEENPTSDEIIDQFLSSASISNQIIMLVLVFFLPMVIMLTLFIVRKDKKGTIWNYVQKFLFYCLAFFGMFCMTFYAKNLIAMILLMVVVGAVTIITVIDMILHKKTEIVTLFFETICMAECILLIVQKNYFIFVVVWGFYLILFIWMIIKMNIKSERLTSPYLPFGILRRREIWFRYLYMSSTFSVAMVFLLDDYIGYFYLAILGILILFIAYLYFKALFLNIRPILKYQKTLDIDMLEKEITKIKELPDLHPNTICYYNILFMRYVLAHDKTKFFEYYKMCDVKPENKILYPLYRGLILRYGMTKEEFEHSYEVLKRENFNRSRLIKRYDKFYQFWLPYYGTNPRNITLEKTYKTNHKKREYPNAISLFILIYYYKNENQMDKVEELKTLFLNKYSMLQELVKDLEKLENAEG